MSFTKYDFIREVLTQHPELDIKTATACLDTVFKTIIEQLKTQSIIKISDFGTFSKKERPEREGRNPKTGEKVNIKAKKVIHFRPSFSFKEAVNS